MPARIVLTTFALGLLVISGCSSGSATEAGGPASGQQPGGAAGSGHPAAATRMLTRVAGPRYYLALGDSLSQGVQPTAAGASVSTGAAYPVQLTGLLRRHGASLRLVRLGCSGETSATMIHGGSCRYPAGSQLSEAVRFLRQHRRHVALITIDIGANDPNSCVLAGRLSHLPACLSARLSSTSRNMARILSALRSAGGRDVEIVGMTYYVPELAEWLAGRTGAEFAVLSERLVVGYNQLLAGQYRRAGARVANVFAAFRSADFGPRAQLTRPGHRPPNVAAICELTWMCATPPRGPNEHANAAGYQVIAQAFWHAIAA